MVDLTGDERRLEVGVALLCLVCCVEVAVAGFVDVLSWRDCRDEPVDLGV